MSRYLLMCEHPIISLISQSQTLFTPLYASLIKYIKQHTYVLFVRSLLTYRVHRIKYFHYVP